MKKISIDEIRFLLKVREKNNTVSIYDVTWLPNENNKWTVNIYDYNGNKVDTFKTNLYCNKTNAIYFLKEYFFEFEQNH